MGLIWALAVHGIWPALELALHGLTPLTIVSALTFGNIAVLFSLGARMVSTAGGRPNGVVRYVVALWTMASISMLLWAECVVLLHDAGLL